MECGGSTEVVEAALPSEISLWTCDSLRTNRANALRRGRGPTVLTSSNHLQQQQQDVVVKRANVIDRLGKASADAQGLNAPITTAAKLGASENRMYVLREPLEAEKPQAIGFIKVGRKSLFLTDHGEHPLKSYNALCVLDFFVHPSFQRSGHGKRLFVHMLEHEQCSPADLALDRPSAKFRSFMAKHYQLTAPLYQANNFVVYQAFFTQSNCGIRSSRSVKAQPDKKQAPSIATMSSVSSGTQTSVRNDDSLVCSPAQSSYLQSFQERQREPAVARGGAACGTGHLQVVQGMRSKPRLQPLNVPPITQSHATPSGSSSNTARHLEQAQEGPMADREKPREALLAKLPKANSESRSSYQSSFPVINKPPNKLPPIQPRGERPTPPHSLPLTSWKQQVSNPQPLTASSGENPPGSLSSSTASSFVPNVSQYRTPTFNDATHSRYSWRQSSDIPMVQHWLDEKQQAQAKFRTRSLMPLQDMPTQGQKPPARSRRRHFSSMDGILTFSGTRD